jgi:NAD(P)-dependent dehydrogenase (short-subunit alcohol dehydrogenase family)
VARYPELAGRVVLVTGAGRGIGAAIARAFAAEGARVVVNDVDAEAAAATVATIETTGATAEAAAADVGAHDEARRLVEEIVGRHGRLDVLVSNAGINPVAPLLDLTQATWERVQRVNEWALFHCGQRAARQMTEQGGGSIVVISSPAAEETYEGQTHYAAAKAGLQMLALGFAWELGPLGVRTNLVTPGWIETELNREYLWSEPDLRERVVRQIPLRRTGSPEDVARAVVWLASDEAAYVNGAALRVDGGLVAGRLKA